MAPKIHTFHLGQCNTYTKLLPKFTFGENPHPIRDIFMSEIGFSPGEISFSTFCLLKNVCPFLAPTFCPDDVSLYPYPFEVPCAKKFAPTFVVVSATAQCTRHQHTTINL